MRSKASTKTLRWLCLGMKPAAPACTTEAIIRSSASEETTMTGTPAAARFSRISPSSPSTSGSFRSSRITSGAGLRCQPRQALGERGRGLDRRRRRAPTRSVIDSASQNSGWSSMISATETRSWGPWPVDVPLQDPPCPIAPRKAVRIADLGSVAPRQVARKGAPDGGASPRGDCISRPRRAAWAA